MLYVLLSPPLCNSMLLPHVPYKREHLLYNRASLVDPYSIYHISHASFASDLAIKRNSNDQVAQDIKLSPDASVIEAIHNVEEVSLNWNVKDKENKIPVLREILAKHSTVLIMAVTLKYLLADHHSANQSYN